MIKYFVLTLAILLAACGGRDTTASKSAAAYREPQAKGTPVGGGDAHGHEHGSAATGTSAPADHAAHPGATAGDTAVDHAAMGHGTAAEHAGHTAAQQSGAGHAGHSMPQQSTAAHAGHTMPQQGGAGHAGHSMPQQSTAGHAGHAATQQTAPGHAGHTAAPAPADPHAAHRAAPAPESGAHAQHGSAPAAPMQMKAPTSSKDAVRPDATLRQDDFDAPAPASVSEAARAAGGGVDHSSHGSGAAAVYTCPMHPEVTSATPGTCPKCGMSLVKKDSSK